MNSEVLRKGGVICLAVLFAAGCSQQARRKKYFESARKYEAQGKIAEAVIEYRNCLRLDPNFVEVRLSLAKLLLKQGDGTGAEVELRKVVEANPENFEARVMLGQLYLLARQPDRAEQQARTALALHRENEDASLLLGQALLLAKRMPEAQKTFGDVLRQNSKNVPAWLGLSDCWLVQGDVPGAEHALQQALIASDRLPRVLLALAVFLEQHKRTPEAQELLEEAQQRDPENIAVLVTLAALYSRTGQGALAESALVRVRDLSPGDSFRRILLANYYLAASQKEKALEELRQLVRKDGPEGPAGEKLGSVLLDENRMDEVKSLIAEMRKKDKQSAIASYLEGRIKLGQRDFSGALQNLHEAIRYLPKNATLYHFQGLAYVGQKNEMQALNSFGQSLQLDPLYGPPRLERAQLEQKNGQAQAALEDAAVLVRVWPIARAWVLYADALTQNGQIQQAEKLLEWLISQGNSGPLRALFRTQAAALNLSKKEFSKARAQLERARAEAPQSTVPDQLMAASYVMQGQPNEAERVLATARAQYPKSTELLFLLANVYVRRRKFAAAKALYDETLRADPASVPGRLGLAEWAAAQQDWGSAASELEQTGRAQKSAAILVRAGQAREQAKQTDLARQDYEGALRLDPANAVALNNLSWIYMQNGGNVDLALRYAEEAKELMPNAPEVSDTLAWAYYLKNRYRFAIELLERAVRAKPDHAMYHYHLAKCYLGLQERQRARQALEKALRSRGDFPREDAVRDLQSLENPQ